MSATSAPRFFTGEEVVLDLEDTEDEEETEEIDDEEDEEVLGSLRGRFRAELPAPKKSFIVL